MQKRLIPAIILVAYSALLIKLLVLKDVAFKIGHLMFNFSGHTIGQANFVPFATILPYLLGEKGWVIALFNLGGNIALFMPFGFLVPFIYRSMTWRASLAVAIAAPLAIEGVQVAFRMGIFDIDDVILNGFGVMIGYWVFVALARLMRHRSQ